ncbi:MAG: hydrolase [Sphingobium sp.]
MTFDPATTALVLIDLQKGIVANRLAPHDAAAVVARSAALADAFRAAGVPVVLVSVDWSHGFVDALAQPVDMPMARPADGPADDFAAIVPAVGPHVGDILIVKRQWGAFHGTELDLQLRRRGIATIVLAGIATNLGVESTARAAWEHGYGIVFAEDATSSFTADMHDFAFGTIFPRIGQVSDCATILSRLSPVG